MSHPLHKLSICMLCTANDVPNNLINNVGERGCLIFWRNNSLFSANCPFGKMFFRRKVRSSKCRSVRQNVCSTKCPSAKCPFGKMSFGEVSSGKVSFGKMSGYRQVSVKTLIKSICLLDDNKYIYMQFIFSRRNSLLQIRTSSSSLQCWRYYSC
jgi:hypothetical protein